MAQGNGEHGGYRRPSNPAALSGPGKYARRTDGQPNVDLPNAGYGEQAAYQEAQAGAPLGAAQSLPSPSGSGGGNPLAGLVGMGAPSTQPGTPVTAGAGLGAGPGTEALGLPTNQRQADKADAQVLRPALQAMITAASSPSATPSFQALVRRIIASS